MWLDLINLPNMDKLTNDELHYLPNMNKTMLGFVLYICRISITISISIYVHHASIISFSLDLSTNGLHFFFDSIFFLFAFGVYVYSIFLRKFSKEQVYIFCFQHCKSQIRKDDRKEWAHSQCYFAEFSKFGICMYMTDLPFCYFHLLSLICFTM